MSPEPESSSWRNLAFLALGLIAVVVIALLLSRLDAFQRRSELPSNGTQVEDLDATIAAGELATIYLPGEVTPVPTAPVTPTRLEEPTASPVSQTPTIEANVPCDLAEKTWTTYTVKSGDTWSSLAHGFGIAEDTLRDANCLARDHLLGGQEISVPVTTAAHASVQKCAVPSGWSLHQLQPGETLSALARRHGIRLNQLMKANCMRTPDFTGGSEIYLP